MSDVNVRASDPRNLLVVERASLWLRNRGSTDPADMREVGCVMDAEFDNQDQRLKHKTNRRGAVVTDREIIIDRALGLNFKLEEINLHNLQYMFGDGEDAQPDSVDMSEGFVKANPGNGEIIDLGHTDVKNVILRSLALDGAETTYLEATDYSVDLSSGIVTILAGALADEETVPEVHIYFEKELEGQAFRLFPGQELEVEAKLQILGEGGVQQIYVIPRAVIKVAGSITFGNGDTFQSVPMRLESLGSASSGSLGKGIVVNEGEMD
jgi:hypothetical protein